MKIIVIHPCKMQEKVIHNMKILIFLLLLVIILVGTAGGAIYTGIIKIENDWTVSFSAPAPEEKPAETEVQTSEKQKSKKRKKELSEFDYSNPAERQLALKQVDEELKQEHEKTLTFMNEHDASYTERKERNDAIKKWVKKYE